MKCIDIKNSIDNLDKLIDEVNVGYNPIAIVSDDYSAVLISEEEWNNIFI